MNKRGTSRVPLEVEIKLAIEDPKRIRKQLLKMGFRQDTPRALEKNWVFDFDGQTLRKKGQLLRLRDYLNQNLLTFKGSSLQSKHYKIRLELETEVHSSSTFLKILAELGLKPRFRYEKYRTMFSPEDSKSPSSVIVTIDETPIGNFVEIEGKPKSIRLIAAALGFSAEQYITKSYTELFFESKLARTRKDMVFSQASIHRTRDSSIN
ncbi:MAG: class IV adenylate cyclase [Terriglobia bacterium]